MSDFRIGFGVDVHQLVEGRDLIIGGIKLDSDFGALGHSDADVLIHSICDAMLGACNLGDIGKHFPDSSEGLLLCGKQLPKFSSPRKPTRRQALEQLSIVIPVTVVSPAGKLI